MKLGQRDLAREGAGHAFRIASCDPQPYGVDPGSAAERDDPTLGVDGRLAAQALELGAGDLVASAIAGAHERPRLDVLEAELQGLDLHLGELVRMVVALQRQVLEGRPQVLPDRQDVAVDLARSATRSTPRAR